MLSVMGNQTILFSFSWHLQKYFLFLNQTLRDRVTRPVLVAQLELERPRCQSVNPVHVSQNNVQQSNSKTKICFRKPLTRRMERYLYFLTPTILSIPVFSKWIVEYSFQSSCYGMVRCQKQTLNQEAPTLNTPGSIFRSYPHQCPRDNPLTWDHHVCVSKHEGIP